MSQTKQFFIRFICALITGFSTYLFFSPSDLTFAFTMWFGIILAEWIINASAPWQSKIKVSLIQAASLAVTWILILYFTGQLKSLS